MSRIERHLPSLSLAFNPSGAMDLLSSPFVNCYAYALNLPESMMATPGNLAKLYDYGMEKRDIRERIIKQKLREDGLEEISAVEALSGKFHAVACRIAPFKGLRSTPDFHFLRLDHQDGTWSHKPGTFSPVDVDEHDKIIDSPENAVFSGYDVFCGYYALPEDGILYVPRHYEFAELDA